MKAAQFWILIVCSIIVSILLVQTVFLNRELNRKQRVLVDNQETIATTATYERAWKQLAIRIYEAGKGDPEMIQLLKSEGVNVYAGTPPPDGGKAEGAPALPSKTPAPSSPAAHAGP